jgi:hypothetical protein
LDQQVLVARQSHYLHLEVIRGLHLEDISVVGFRKGGLVPPGLRGLVALAVKISTHVLESDRGKVEMVHTMLARPFGVL